MKNKIRPFVIGTYIALFWLLIIYMIYASLNTGSGRNLIKPEVTKLESGWVIPETGEHVTLPNALIPSSSTPVTISRKLPPHGKANWVLLIRSNHQFIDVNVDDKLVYSFHSLGSSSARSRFGGYLPAQWFEVAMNPDWYGGILSITYTPDGEPGTDPVGEVFLGDKLSVIFQLLKDDFVFLMTVLTLLLFGILLLFFNYVLHRNGMTRTGFTYISINMILFGLWFFSSLCCVQVFSSNLILMENLGVLCLFMVPPSMLLYSNHITEYHYYKLAYAFFALSMAVIIAVVIIFLTRGGRQLIQMVPLANALYLLPLSFTAYAGIHSMFTDKPLHNRMRWYMYLMFIMFISAILEFSFRMSRVSMHHNRAGIFATGGTMIMSFGVLIWAAMRYRAMLERITAVEAENKAKTEFYSGISHKIRTPINAMLGMNEMILRESGEEQIRNYAKDVKESGDTLMAMVDEMLMFSEGTLGDVTEILPGVENIRENTPHNRSESEGSVDPSGEETTPDVFGKFTAPKASVLVVDDTDVNLRLVDHMLKRTKIRVACAESGAECLDIVRSDIFDVILMDHMMPDMDGIQTLKELKKMGDENMSRSAVVIALTANAIEGTKDFYISQGFDDYLSKPVDGPALEQMLWKYIPDRYIIMNDEVSGADKQNSPDSNRDDSRPNRIIASLEGVVDTETGLEYCMGDPDFYVQSLERFIDPEKQNVLVQDYENKDTDNYRVHVHSLKSTAKMLGAQHLSDMAAALEEAAADNNTDFIIRNHPDMINEYTRVRILVDSAFYENPGTDKEALPPMEMDEFIHLIEEIRDGVDSFDMDSADTACNKLSSSNLPKDYEEDVKRLTTLVADVDMDSALTLAEDILFRIKSDI